MKEGYTIIIASDFHSNATACTYFIKAIHKKQVDEIVLLGDYISDFPIPQATLDQLYQLMSQYKVTCLRGNREQYFLSHHLDWKPSSQSGSLYHTMRLLREKDLTFFQSLPFVEYLHNQDTPGLVFTHGSPLDCIEHLYPNHDNTHSYMLSMKEQILISGHTHTPCMYYHHDKCLLNPGSVGLPLHGNPNGQYASLTWKNKQWYPKLHTFSYPYKQEQQRILDTNFIEEAHTWGIASWLSVQYANNEHSNLLKTAYNIANGEPISELHFLQSAKQCGFPTYDEIRTISPIHK